MISEDGIVVRYLYADDLVCELTEYFDTFVKNKSSLTYCKTYLYNDIAIFSNENLLRIAFRYPGATRGSILLKRLDKNRFEIQGFQFNTDVCFGSDIGCYDESLKDNVDKWVGRILDFSQVELINN